jgi:UDP-N-acetyl-D-mannosaminuronate dehydrogenase
MTEQDIVVGVGEIGTALYKLFQNESRNLIAYDNDANKVQFSNSMLKQRNCTILHICLPYTVDFTDKVMRYVKDFPCKELVIHSTVRPGTTDKLQERLNIPVVYSPVRGVHVRMLEDLKHYTKYWSTKDKNAVQLYPDLLKACKIKNIFWDSPTQLELAKILMDTTYYGWLILFAQRVKILCDKYGVDEPSIWRFTEEIHKFLGNRPLMYPGEGIKGHCVLQNLEILDDDFIDLVFTHDKIYRRHLREQNKK